MEQAFVVETQSNPHLYNVACSVSIDGQSMDEIAIERSSLVKSEGAYIDESTIRPYQFSTITLTGRFL